MSEKCPTCGRAIRKKKPKPTAYEVAMARAKASVAVNLRKQMPKATKYKE